MSQQIKAHLDELYGAADAAKLASQVEALISRYRPQLARRQPAPSIRLTEADAILITYGDQVQARGETPLRTLASFAQGHLTDLVSAVHILPFYPWSSDDGFSVKDYFAVDPALGDWTDVGELGTHFDLMFDAVFNHMSAQGDWFQRFLKAEPKFSDFFVTVDGNPDLSRVVRPRALPLLTEFRTSAGLKNVWTTFSADQVDLNVKSPHVLVALLEALLFYVEKGARYVRLDAIAYLWKEIGTSCIHLPQTHRVIQLMRCVLDEVAPEVMLVTETNVPHADNISYFGDGTNEAQMVYNFALPPLVLHAIATGSAEKLTRWAQSLTTPSDRTTFFNFLSSHDGIGINPARGILSQTEIDGLVARVQEHGGFVSYKHNSDGSKSPYELNITYFDALSNPNGHEPVETQVKRFLTAHAIMLSLRGVPGIYFHSLFGSRNDRAGVDASGIPRRINRQKLQRQPLEQELSAKGTLRSLVFDGFGQLLRQRRAHPAFAPTADQEVLNVEDPRILAILRQNHRASDSVLCLHNISSESVAFDASKLRSAKISLAPYDRIWLPRRNGKFLANNG